MNSIDRNQPAKNREDLRGDAAIRRIRDMVEQSQTCFFCTHASVADSTGARPMTVLKTDDDGTLWFLSASDSHKNLELQRDSRVTLHFQGTKHSDFLLLHGSATANRDRAKIEELWNPIFKTWFTEGLDDPRITVIAVFPVEGYYWDTKHGNFVAGINMFLGAALGEPSMTRSTGG